MGKFGDSVERNVATIKSAIENRIRQALKNTFADVVMGTPVDTGLARANWQCQIDGMSQDGVIRETDPAGANTIARIAAELENFRIGKTRNICLTNNVPYIGFLEYGTMNRAPAGMVRNAIANFERHMGR